MVVQNVYRTRIAESIRRVDYLLLSSGRRISLLVSEYRYFLAVLLIGFVVWAVVFNIALVDYLNTRYWNSRTAWLGPFPNPGDFNLFGYTIQYQFEGYSDYSFYYVHWGYNLLYGVMPYSGSFGYLDMLSIVNENGAYMFPPLTAYLYAFGIALGEIIGPGNWGIGLLFAIFGYFTIIPVYGIAREVSKNPRVGEIAALTYAINPLVLYHIDYLWLNPAPFYFFFFAGFYALLKGKRYTGTILIVTAAMFKQTAWFLGIPLVVYLLVRPRNRKTDSSDALSPDGQDNGALGPQEEKKTLLSRLDFLLEYFDFRGFMVCAVLAVAYVGAIMLPYILAQPDFLRFWSLALGGFSFNGNYVDPIPYNVPVRLPLIPIMYGMPQIAEFLDAVIFSSAPLYFGVTVLAGLMILLDRYKGEEHMYLRRILFFTMLLMLWTDIVGPRGVFKYYFALFGPFFSIFSSSRMTLGKGEHVSVSASMFWMPILFSLSILIPDRNYYLIYVLCIFIFYALSSPIGKLYGLTKRPLSFLRRIVSQRTSFHLGTLVFEDTISESVFYHVMTKAAVIISLFAGSALLVIGVTICFTFLTATLEVIMQFLLLMGVMIFMGVQLVSIATNGLVSYRERRSDIDYVLRTMSFTLATFLLIFAIDTYIISWTVDLFIPRQLMIISSMLIIMWALGLVIQIETKSRLLSDILLLASCILGTWVWSSLGDLLFLLFGLTCISGLAVHLLLTSSILLAKHAINITADVSLDTETSSSLTV